MLADLLKEACRIQIDYSKAEWRGANIEPQRIYMAYARVIASHQPKSSGQP